MRPAALVVAVTLAATGAGCGAGGDQDADPAQVAPAASSAYVVATVRPDGDEQEAVDQIARKVFRVSGAGTRIQQLLDRSFSQHRETRNVTYADDVEPWLGRRAAVAITRLGHAGPITAAIFAAKDAGRAKQFVDKVAEDASPRWPRRWYRGVEYRFDADDASGQGVVGNYLVAGDEDAFKAVVDASKSGRGLADDPRYRRNAGDHEDGLGFGYVDVRALAAGLSARAGLPPGALPALTGASAPSQPVSFWLAATPDRITIYGVARGLGPATTGSTPSAPVPELPGDAWLALGIRRVGRSLRHALGRGGARAPFLRPVRKAIRSRTGLDLDRDLLAAVAHVAFFARGPSPLSLGAGLVVRTTDTAAARRVVSGLRRFVERETRGRGLRTADARVAGARGFKVTARQLRKAINVVFKGDRVVAAYGYATTRDALGTKSPLSSAPGYRAARESLGGAQPALFVAFAPLASLVRQGSPDALQAAAYLDALRTLAIGGRAQGARRTGRMVLTLR